MVETTLARNPRSEILVLESQRLLLTEDERQLLVDLEPHNIFEALAIVQKVRQRENLKKSACHGSGNDSSKS